jgi:hypothetical protein
VADRPGRPAHDEGGATTHSYRFTADLWQHEGGSWHFVTVPFDTADEIDELTHGRQGGFGSVRVTVTVGSTSWSTSLFPDTKRRSYVLPVKQAVRRAERLEVGRGVDVRLDVALS